MRLVILAILLLASCGGGASQEVANTPFGVNHPPYLVEIVRVYGVPVGYRPAP